MSSGPYVIGLTGNIATGKSLVAQIMVAWGAEHIDADRLAHQAMARGTATWVRIVDAFGDQILGADGEIDRSRLGSIVFSAPDALARLERIVHPDVIARTRARIAHSNARVCVVEAIKLIESGMVAALCDALWVVTAPREVQIARLIAERGMSRADAVLRVDAQPPQADKVARADVVIDNGGSIEAVRAQVARAWAAIDRTVGTRNVAKGDGP
ncbi:MAG: dephospho-CoA kinase [Anaerolineae bacterium]|nr:dephospho-CoA kinase [Anaerolineae bacterium]